MCSNILDPQSTASQSHSRLEVREAKIGTDVMKGGLPMLLELAADNDWTGFKQAVEEQGAKVDECGSWYCRQFGSNKMAVVERSPIMIAALFGSLEVLHYILKHLAAHGGDINKVCGEDRTSVLHCAMASGARNTTQMVKLLLSHGADPTLVDSQGLRYLDVKLRSHIQNATPHEKALVDMVTSSESEVGDWKGILPDSVSETSMADLDEIWGLHDDSGMMIASPLPSSPTSSPKSAGTGSEKACKYESSQDYPCDVLSSEVKSSIYTTDEFRMYSFKVRPCSRAYSHDWTECPFVHPGENARRRDPKRFHYSCVPCPDFRKGACRHGDACEYAHGVFESWLHPAQYRTRLCKDGTSCTRKVCFFAHTKEEVRPLYLSTDCGGTSPRLMSPIDVVSLSSPRAPASPSATLRLSSFSPSVPNLGHPSYPSSLSSDKSLCGTWTHPGLPTLCLPEGAQASRLRASLSARDINVNSLSDVDGQLMREAASLSAQARLNAALAAVSGSTTPSRDGKHQNFGSLNLTSTNLEDLSAAVSPRSPLQLCLQQLSPRVTSKFHDTATGNVGSMGVEDLIASSLGSSPRHWSSSQLQYDDSSMQVRKPIRISQFQQSELGCCLQDPMTPQSSSLNLGSPSHFSRIDAGFVHQRSMASPLSPAHATTPSWRDNGSQTVKDSDRGLSWLDWGSPTGKPEWGVSGEDLSQFRKSTSLKANKLRSEKSDLLWVQDLGRSEGFLDGHGASSTASTACAANMPCKA